MKKFNIIWEKYTDPQEEWLEELQKKLGNLNEEFVDEDSEDGFAPSKKIYAQAYPMPPVNTAAKSFNLWYIHTTFYITKEIAQLIVSFPGIEIFQPISPYRAILAFGKAFQKSDGSVSHMRKQLEDTLIKSILNQAIENVQTEEEKEEQDVELSDVDKLISTLKREKQEFVLFVLPNQKIELATSSEIDDALITKHKIFTDAAEKIGGTIIKSWD